MSVWHKIFFTDILLIYVCYHCNSLPGSDTVETMGFGNGEAEFCTVSGSITASWLEGGVAITANVDSSSTVRELLNARNIKTWRDCNGKMKVQHYMNWSRLILVLIDVPVCWNEYKYVVKLYLQKLIYLKFCINLT